MINYDENNVTLTFTKDEAIVLFEWVCNFNNKNPKGESFDDQAEQRVLWNNLYFDEIMSGPTNECRLIC